MFIEHWINLVEGNLEIFRGFGPRDHKLATAKDNTTHWVGQAVINFLPIEFLMGSFIDDDTLSSMYRNASDY